MIQGENYTVHIGNNLDILPTLQDCSVDSIVTDPPYELGFMGKKWDSSGIAYNLDLWRECLRVLKPGGHLLAFSGSRTYHRMVVAIEDAGFEIRDMIAWISNKTFPKSLDISKAIDKGTGENKQRQLKFVNWMRSTGITAKQINEATETQMASHYIGLSQPAIATADLFDKLRPYLPEVPEEIERLVAERTGIEWIAYKNREVVGKHNAPASSIYSEDKKKLSQDVYVTKSATPEAKQWEGWGTALKPTVEPIVMARKPLIGTVAENVLTYGTGGLNIDASRIETTQADLEATEKKNGSFKKSAKTNKVFGQGLGITNEVSAQGRWPANVILDQYSAELLDEQSGQVKGGTWNNTEGARHFNNDGNPTGYETKAQDNSVGGASRFFYVARASKRDRNEGLEQSNTHPTVKPTDLMRYLIKLVTPPNGIVLDPFTGSGSTGKAAILDGFRFIGIEMTEDYIPIIEGRLKHAEAERGLF
jgi:DNA modification methylase